MRKKASRMGFCIIICDHEIKVLAMKCIMRMGSWESTVVEAMATYYGAIFYQERGVPHIILEGDANQITDAIQAKGRNTSIFDHLVDDVNLFLNVFPKWQVNACVS